VVVYYSDDVQEAILRFPPGLQARYIHLTEGIVTFGPNLGMPHTRSLGKGLFELRLKSPEGIARVFFCNLPGRRVMMLHAFVKEVSQDAKPRIENGPKPDERGP